MRYCLSLVSYAALLWTRKNQWAIPWTQHQGGIVMKRVRRIGSVKQELLSKSREAALAAVQIFNNPTIAFKSEIFAVLMIIAWTYLLHAYYQATKVDYRYFNIGPTGRRRYVRTETGQFKYWDCRQCLKDSRCPLDPATRENLRFITELRDEIEHRMTARIDDLMSARFQASCLNYNEYVRRLFGDKYGIEKHLAFSLQFSALDERQADLLKDHQELPPYVTRFIQDFDNGLDDMIFQDQRFAYRVLFVPKTANHKGQADRVIDFVAPNSGAAAQKDAERVVLKETEKPKCLPGHILELMHAKGFVHFNMHDHTLLWQSRDARNPSLGYGVTIGRTWYWYDRWLKVVEEYCSENEGEFV